MRWWIVGSAECRSLLVGIYWESDAAGGFGTKILGGEQQTYFMANKPRGYVTTLDDPEKRPTVMQLLEQDSQKKQAGSTRGCGYVGRAAGLLSEGCCDDERRRSGEQAAEASAGVLKTYLVKVSGAPAASAIDQLRRGIHQSIVGG